MPLPDRSLATERLTLRPFTPDDLDDAHAYMRLPEVARYLYGEPRDRAETAAALARKIGAAALARKIGDVTRVGVTR